MRKTIIGHPPSDTTPEAEEWLDLEQMARVEISSESEGFPVESALHSAGAGWKAAEPGRQLIRLLFDRPARIRRILLEFHEEDQPRTQELSLRWSSADGRDRREIVRQQYHFSPPTTTSQIEDYRVELDDVEVVELEIVPEVGGGDVHASLARMRLA